ncbi:MAG: acyltransferase [Phycicoccus sp.]|nr:acyltransferase [Phycicoccus sp.]
MARMLAAGSNDVPLLRTIRRHLLIKLLRAPNLRMGSHVRLDRSHPNLGGRLYLGSAVEIGPRCILDISGGIDIRDAVTVSEDSLLLSHDHNFDDPDVHWRDQGQTAKPLTIGEGAWIGARSTLVGAGTIGAGAVIGATSLVTRPVEPNVLALGSPARPIRLRGTRRVAPTGDE